MITLPSGGRILDYHNQTGKTIMEQMQNLDCVLSWRGKETTPLVQIEEPTELQAQILAALGYQIKDGSVLQISA